MLAMLVNVVRRLGRKTAFGAQRAHDGRNIGQLVKRVALRALVFTKRSADHVGGREVENLGLQGTLLANFRDTKPSYSNQDGRREDDKQLKPAFHARTLRPKPRRVEWKAALGLTAALALGGCAWIPWHPFGTPLTAEKKAEAKVEVASADTLHAVQEAVHKFNYAMELVKLGNLLAVDVAGEQARIAEQQLDQVLGQPRIGDDAKWRDLIVRLASDNAKTRETAQRENAAVNERNASLSADLDGVKKKLEAKEKEAMQYAAEKEHTADLFLKLCWGVGIYLAFRLLGQLLAFLAHFNPAFAAPAAMVNAIDSPALLSLWHRAESKVAAVAAAAVQPPNQPKP